MENLWNSRYDTEEFVYGRKANSFFARHLQTLNPGRILLPGEGEGRNAVYAASLGWEVHAFDQSGVAVTKARNWLDAIGLQVNYQTCSLEAYPFRENYFDMVGLVFVHLASESREYLHMKAVKALKPGGTLLLQAFHHSQLGNSSGGPQSLDLLYDRTRLLEDFTDLSTVMIEETVEILDEGLFHRGPANLISYLGTKV